MSETSVGTDLFQSFQIVTELAVQLIGKYLRVLTIDEVTLTVKEPRRDLVLGGVLEDGNDTLELFDGKLTGSIKLVRKICYYRITSYISKILTSCSSRHQPSCKPSSNNDDPHPIYYSVRLITLAATIIQYRRILTYLDQGESVHNLDLTINVGVEETVIYYQHSIL